MHGGKPNGPELLLPMTQAAPEEFDKPGEECGVFGIYAPGEPVALLTYNALHRLQTRGQNGAGIMVPSDFGIIGHKGEGEIDQAIPEAIPVHDTKTGRDVSHLDEIAMHPPSAIGHVRYMTAGDNSLSSIQPISPKSGDSAGPPFALATNGHVELFPGLADKYGLDPADFSSDSSYVAALYARQAVGRSLLEAVLEISPQLNGAMSSVMLDGHNLIALRDPWGFRPLSLGELPEGRGYAFASETGAFDVIGATFVRDVEPGEVVVVNQSGIESHFMDRQENIQHCMFEYIYFARPGSVINGVSVYRARENMGRMLARNHGVDADIVVGVRESGTGAAAGYSKESGLFKEEGLFKNPYAKRSFIEGGHTRTKILDRKQEANNEVLDGQRVVLVDDSIIKGNTMQRLVAMIREAGAKEVHVRSAAPRYLYPCYMGMDTRDAHQLIARTRSNQAIADLIGADSVEFNTVEEVQEAIEQAAKTEQARGIAGRLCTACTTGNYPFEVPQANDEVAASQILLPMI